MDDYLLRIKIEISITTMKSSRNTIAPTKMNGSFDMAVAVMEFSSSIMDSNSAFAS